MSQCFRPRLSEAIHILPLLRNHLTAAASRLPLSTGLALQLLPIVEDGLFGYEIVPDRETHTYLTIGRNARGEPVLRKTLYGTAAGNALKLVVVNGQALSRSERATRYHARQRDATFPGWDAAAEAVWAQLRILFPERPRRPVVVSENAQRCLEEALSVAHLHLAPWNPFIHFCGLPNEAQQGFALEGTSGEHGELVYQRPDIWILRWKAPPHAVYESWSAVDTTSNLVRGDRASQAHLLQTR